jgi:hypothetical protein
MEEIDSIGFWWWCITHRIAGVLDFVHRPDFNSYKKNEQTQRFVSETGSVSVLRWEETPILLGPLERDNLVTNTKLYKHLRPGWVNES